MTFDKNHPIIFVLVAIIILVVMAQSVFFMLRALKRAKQIKMDTSKIKKTIVSSAVFTIAPAISIVICVITLAKDLGVAVPWLRLSVIGSLSYETVAANNALSGMGLKLGDPNLNLNASQFVTVVFVMTISIMVGLLLAPIIGKKLQKGLISIGKKRQKLGGYFPKFTLYRYDCSLFRFCILRFFKRVYGRHKCAYPCVCNAFICNNYGSLWLIDESY
jgi:hypothetical protein